jgi:hypothetical protein
VYAGEEADLYPLVNEGLTLYHEGRFFEAHELWEAAWAGEVGRNKLLLQALIQIAAALHKAGEGNQRGPSKLLAKARGVLAEIGSASAWLGLDLVALCAELESALAAADRFAAGEVDRVPPPELPARTGPDGIVYLHGFASSPASFKARAIAEPLANDGFFVEVPDLNEGDFEHLTLSRSLARARRLVRDRTILIGSSFGGYAASLLAEKDDRIVGLVLLAPAFDLARRMKDRYGPAAIDAWRKAGTTLVDHHAWGGKHPIGFGLLEDAERHAAMPRVRVPTYVLHGAADDVVPAELARAYGAQNPSIEVDIVDDGHGLEASTGRALAKVRAMIERLALQPAPAVAERSAAEERLRALAEAG